MKVPCQRCGQPVEIAVDGFPGTKVKGHVDSVAPASGLEFALLPPDNASGNFVKVTQRIPVKIVFTEKPDKNHPLSAGMNVVVEVKVK